MTRTWLGLALWSLLSACTLDDKGEETAPPETGEPDPDQDGDGYLTDEDCNDEDATINPGVYETCNGVDDDCDGEIDDGIATTWYADKDGDGFGDPEDTTESCFKPDGYVPIGTDCDDAVADIYPGRAELCDGLDNDCDGDIDEDATNGEDTATWYRDDDGDGYGDPDADLTACGTPEGYVEDSSDCDDDDEETYPGADEFCDDEDDDCDGEIDDDPVDPGTFYTDADGDTYGDPETETVSCDQPAGTVEDGTDCDDAHDDSYPDADEVCDERDNDCDGAVDEDAVDAETWYDDGDGDGYGDADDATTSCEAPDGSVSTSTDCDDADSGVHPGATEYCDGEDDDCDGSIDEGAADISTWYADDDDDGYGDGDDATTACDAPSGYVDDDTDCDDTDSGVHPGATEYCDDEDDDCDGSIDESAVDMTTWYKDSDSDAYGDSTKKKTACDMPTGYVSDKTDCDDTDSGVHPGATEYCDDEDDDCDGSIDEDAVDATTWYRDADSDTWGGTTTTTSCDAPTGYVSRGSDCDETDSGVYPGATEYCDGEDDDCDGSIDEGAVDVETWYADDDDDGYGDEDSATTACDAPSGYVTDDTDCDDTDSGVHPGASEYCDDEDDDCDGSIDEGAVDRGTWYKDADGDDYGDSSSSKKACDEPSGYTSDKTDCDDTDSGVHPGATEYCDDEDDDCDGSIDESAVDMSTWYKDNDSDTYGGTTTTTACDKPTGYVSRNSDCDDTDSGVYPGATEYCDDEDDDCDGSIDEGAVDMTTWYKDNDSDSYGGSTSSTACDMPSGYTASSSDCDDSSASVYPGAMEVCEDGVDQDCDGEDAGCALSGDVDLALSEARLIGEENYDYAAGTIASAGDTNGDSYDDIIVGAYGTGSYVGTSYVVLGPVSGDLDLYLADGKLSGESSNDYSGTVVAPGGDVDGDGYDDVLVGARGEDSAGTAAGAAYLMSGPIAGSVGLSTADARRTGTNTNDNAGFALIGGLDMDLDGYDDLLLSAYQDDSGGTSAGSVFVCMGPVTGKASVSTCEGEVVGETSNDYAGYSVDTADDVDGDGIPDFIIGAYGQDSGASTAGAAYLVVGPVSGTFDLSSAEARRTGIVTNDAAGGGSGGPGNGVGGPGDVDGDGYADLLVGAFNYDVGTAGNAGAAWLLYGPITGNASLSTADAVFQGEVSDDRAGVSVSGASDVDSDGLADFLIGAYREDTGGADAGGAYLFVGGAYSGTYSLSTADALFYGENAGDYIGWDTSPGGDVNGDGYGDMLFGAWKQDAGATDGGTGYLVLGGVM